MNSKILVLDCSMYPEMYEPVAHWRTSFGDVPVISAHVSFGQAVPPLADFTHLVLTGSEASIARPEPWFAPLEAAVLGALELRLPILGSCFGHQMLARVLAGPAYAAPSPTPEVGWIEVEILEEDPLLSGLPRPWRVFASHFDEVRQLPSPWRVLARSAGCGVQVMRYGERRVWGIQAHPEISASEGRRLIEGFLRRAPEKAPFLLPALDQSPADDDVAPRIAHNFLAS